MPYTIFTVRFEQTKKKRHEEWAEGVKTLRSITEQTEHHFDLDKWEQQVMNSPEFLPINLIGFSFNDREIVYAAFAGHGTPGTEGEQDTPHVGHAFHKEVCGNDCEHLEWSDAYEVDGCVIIIEGELSSREPGFRRSEFYPDNEAALVVTGMSEKFLP